MNCDQSTCINQHDKLTKVYACKCCLKRFCGDSCLISHIISDHKEKIVQPQSSKSSNPSLFNKEGVMLKSVINDPYFAFKNFEKVKIGNRFHTLGSGAFGEVFLAKNKIDGRFYAIKQMDKSRIINVGVKPDLVYREINVHLKLVHPHIARLYSYHEDDESFYLIIEYVEDGTLFKVIQKNKGMSEEKAFSYFIQVASAFYFLHNHNLIHRDLKPENCLVANDNIKVCDFGWTVEVSSGTRDTFCGTYEYMAPEVVKERPYNHAIDVWSLGVLLYELIHSYSPFRVSRNVNLGHQTNYGR